LPWQIPNSNPSDPSGPTAWSWPVRCGRDEAPSIDGTVGDIQRRYRELQEAEREERGKCAEAFKAEREARERDKSKRRPKPGKVFPLDPIGPPQLIKRRDYELRTWRTFEVSVAQWFRMRD
jgi:hypothetical protein